MQVVAALAIGLSLAACASQVRTASVTMTHGIGVPDRSGRYADNGGLLTVRSHRCVLSHKGRSEVLAALGGLEPVSEQLGDRGLPEDPSARSGLLFVFDDARGPVLTVTMQDDRPLPTDDGHIRVNGRVARISSDAMIAIQTVAARAGCPPSTTKGSAT
jgi:hypothetical protein